MSAATELDDMNQTVIYIPFAPDEEEVGRNSVLPPREVQHRDIPDGHDLRFKGYNAAWAKCLERVKSIIHALHSPTIDDVVRKVRSSYLETIPCLPYPEIPVIALTGERSSLLDELAHHLGAPQESDSSVFVTHLHPNQCTNLTSALKALISGFVDESTGKSKRKPSASIANYDITLLKVWYNYIKTETEDSPLLVVALHDFEQFEPSVIQDFFYICSLHIPNLPLVFILSLSSPPSPPYLQTTYPRSTLTLLRVSECHIPNGDEFLSEIVLKTFADPEFEPDIILGPGILEYLCDYYKRHDNSLSAILTILQLSHMKHFEEPLTALVHDTLLGTTSTSAVLDMLQKPTSYGFLDAVLGRLHAPSSVPDPDHADSWRNQDLPSLIRAVDDMRNTVYKRAQKMRIAFRLILRVQIFMRAQGYRGLYDNKNGVRGVVDLLCMCMRGQALRDIKWFGMVIKRLPASKLAVLVKDVNDFFQELPESVRAAEEKSVFNMTEFLPAKDSDTAIQFAGWMVDYLQDSLIDLATVKLWDVWYTGMMPFPSELINPSLRATIMSGLLYPNEYADEKQAPRALWELPDTSILFRRYLDSGRMINVYDWYDSFAVVLETQRKKRHPPTNRKGKGKGKQGDEDIEWKREVQARFIRALHELDFLGFLKHTKRKADHVMKTACDLPD